MVHMLYNLIKILSEDVNSVFEFPDYNNKDYILIVKSDNLSNNLHILNLENYSQTVTEDNIYFNFYKQGQVIPTHNLYLDKKNYNISERDISWCILNKKYQNLLNIKSSNNYTSLLTDKILLVTGRLKPILDYR